MSAARGVLSGVTLLLLLHYTTGFTFGAVLPSQNLAVSHGPVRVFSPLRMGFFDAAFANEDVGERQNAGLKNGPKENEVRWRVFSFSSFVPVDALPPCPATPNDARRKSP